jgi:hypothetical protein
MPQRARTEADLIYEQKLAEGWKPKEAAKEAQALTGLSLVTGRRIKDKTGANYVRTFKTTGLRYKGQYG